MAKVGSHFWCMGGVLRIGSLEEGGTALGLSNGSGDEHGAAGHGYRERRGGLVSALGKVSRWEMKGGQVECRGPKARPGSIQTAGLRSKVRGKT